MARKTSTYMNYIFASSVNFIFLNYFAHLAIIRFQTEIQSTLSFLIYKLKQTVVEMPEYT